jgi:hypothetical protein
MIYTIGWNYKTNLPAVFRWNQQWYGHFFRVAFKPVATIMQKQESLDNQGNITEMTGKDVMIHVWSREQCR